MAEDQDLRIHGGDAACQQRQLTEHPDHEEIDEANEHEHRAQPRRALRGRGGTPPAHDEPKGPFGPCRMSILQYTTQILQFS
jgi:hypothetical protein